MDDLIKAFYSIEVHLPSFWWVEGYPVKVTLVMNLFVSKGKHLRPVGMRDSCRDSNAKVAEWLIKTASQRRLGCLSGGNGNRSVPGE